MTEIIAWLNDPCFWGAVVGAALSTLIFSRR